MARKSLVTSNPIREIRIREGKTLEHFAFECGVTLQAVYLNECGVYPNVLPSILRRLTTYYELQESDLNRDYERFVKQKRLQFNERYSPYKTPESDCTKSPIQLFRKLLTLSRVGFAKGICVQPTLLYKVEEAKIDVIPGQIAMALRDIQLPVGEIQEFQERQLEFYCHVRF